MDLCKNLTIYRKQAGFKTRKDFANILEITPVAYGNYELGIRKPSLEALIKIAKLLKVSPNELLGVDSQGNTFTAEEIKLINIYRQLDMRGQQTVIYNAQRELIAKNETEKVDKIKEFKNGNKTT